MTQLVPSYDEVIEEVEKIPVEYLPFALEIVRAFRQSITMNSAVESFRQGWHEAQSGKTTPVSDLWVDINNAE